METDDFEVPALGPQEDELWRSPRHLFDVNTRPELVFQQTRHQTALGRAFFSGFYKDVVAVGDLYTVCFYKIQRVGPYVSAQDRARVEEIGLRYKSEQQIVGLSLGETLVLCTADSKVLEIDYLNDQKVLCQKQFEFPAQFPQQIHGLTVFASGRTIYTLARGEVTKVLEVDCDLRYLRAISGAYVVQTYRERTGSGGRLDTVVQFSQRQIKLACLGSRQISACEQSALVPELVSFGFQDGAACVVDLRRPLQTVQEWVISATPIVSCSFSPSHPDCILLAAADGEARLFRLGFRPLQLADFGRRRLPYGFSLRRAEEFGLLASLQGDGDGDANGFATEQFGAEDAVEGLCGAYSDSACILSHVQVTDAGAVALWMLKSAPATQRWLQGLSRHYQTIPIGQPESLQARVQQKMYARDLSGVLQEVFQSVNARLKENDTAGAEEAFRQFDKCVAYLKARPQPPPALREDLRLEEYFQELFKRIPLGLQARFCIRPTDPDALQHRQLALLLQLKKIHAEAAERLSAKEEEQRLSLKPVESFYRFAEDNPQLVLRALPEALMDCAVLFQQKNATPAGVALRLLTLLQQTDLDLESVLFRPVQPSVFGPSRVEHTGIFKAILSSQGSRFELADPGVLWSVYGEAQRDSDSPVGPLQRHFQGAKSPQYADYLRRLQLFQVDFLGPDALPEEIQVDDAFPVQQAHIVDQPTLCVAFLRHWAANDTERLGKLVSRTAQLVRQVSQPGVPGMVQRVSQSVWEEMQFVAAPKEARPDSLEKELQGPQGFYWTLALMGRLFWERYTGLFRDTLDGYLDLDVARLALDALCAQLRDPFLAFCLAENPLVAQRNRAPQTPEVAEILTQLLQALRQFPNQLDPDYITAATKTLQEALKTTEAIGLRTIADGLLEILAFFRK